MKVRERFGWRVVWFLIACGKSCCVAVEACEKEPDLEEAFGEPMGVGSGWRWREGGVGWHGGGHL